MGVCQTCSVAAPSLPDSSAICTLLDAADSKAACCAAFKLSTSAVSVLNRWRKSEPWDRSLDRFSSAVAATFSAATSFALKPTVGVASWVQRGQIAHGHQIKVYGQRTSVKWRASPLQRRHKRTGKHTHTNRFVG
jgi:hypothetical protein